MPQAHHCDMPHPHPLATLAQVLSTPSSQDGLPAEVESDLRVAGCTLIQEAGIMLNLPQSTMATAEVLFHRFYYVSSMLSFGVTDISVAALYLSTKLNETPVRLRDLINTYLFLLARIRHLLSLPTEQILAGPSSRASGNGSTGGVEKGKEKADQDVWKGFMFEPPGFHDELFWDWKDVIVSSEMQILKRLGFNMQVDLPYSHVINYLKILDLVFEPDVAQLCWSILNDALLTPVYTLQPPHVLACASILLCTRILRIPLPDNWWVLFDATYEDMWSCCGHVTSLWSVWGTKPPLGLLNNKNEHAAIQKRRENRWRRAWILSDSRKAVRRWVEENGGQRQKANPDSRSWTGTPATGLSR